MRCFRVGLERFSQLYSEAVAAVPDVIPALVRREEVECCGDEREDLIEAAGPRRPEERFQFGERLFDRIEIGTVGRKKADLGADGFDGGANLRLFVHREIVKDDHIAGA